MPKQIIRIHNATLDITDLLQILSYPSYYREGIIALQFKPKSGEKLLKKIKQSNLSSLCVAESAEFLFPGISVSEKKEAMNVLAVFPTEWSHFDHLMDQYERYGTGTLFLLDNSLKAASYADEVLIIELDGKKK